MDEETKRVLYAGYLKLCAALLMLGWDGHIITQSELFKRRRHVDMRDLQRVVHKVNWDVAILRQGSHFHTGIRADDPLVKSYLDEALQRHDVYRRLQQQKQRIQDLLTMLPLECTHTTLSDRLRVEPPPERLEAVIEYGILKSMCQELGFDLYENEEEPRPLKRFFIFRTGPWNYFDGIQRLVHSTDTLKEAIEWSFKNDDSTHEYCLVCDSWTRRNVFDTSRIKPGA